MRFETEPGRQMQVDFVVFRRKHQPLSAFVATLGYSRLSFVYFVTNESFESVREGLLRAFDSVGGVSSEVLFDNMKTVVLERDAYGEGKHRFHPGLLHLAETTGFVPRLCRPYRARTQGKVERFNRYLRESFFNPPASRLKGAGLCLDEVTANRQVEAWLSEVANLRVHATTQARPLDLWRDEVSRLTPLPPQCGREELPSPPSARPIPLESVQHPLSVYDALLEVSP